jgi:hypothetical protein
MTHICNHIIPYQNETFFKAVYEEQTRTGDRQKNRRSLMFGYVEIGHWNLRSDHYLKAWRNGCIRGFSDSYWFIANKNGGESLKARASNLKMENSSIQSSEINPELTLFDIRNKICKFE